MQCKRTGTGAESRVYRILCRVAFRFVNRAWGVRVFPRKAHSRLTGRVGRWLTAACFAHARLSAGCAGLELEWGRRVE